MERMLKNAWVNKIQNTSNASWKTIATFAFLTKCNYKMKLLNLQKNLVPFLPSDLAIQARIL